MVSLTPNQIAALLVCLLLALLWLIKRAGDES